jgi:hypothetical protein
MSRDAKNSIGLWVGTVVFMGLFWATLHFGAFRGIPDSWIKPMLGAALALNAVSIIWDLLRRK